MACICNVAVGGLPAGDEAVWLAVPGDGAAASAEHQQRVVYVQDGRHVHLDSSQQEGSERATSAANTTRSVHAHWVRTTTYRLELHLAISELWFGQEWEGILLELLCLRTLSTKTSPFFYAFDASAIVSEWVSD